MLTSLDLSGRCILKAFACSFASGLLAAIALVLPASAGSANDDTQAKEVVAHFLQWQHAVKPSGVYKEQLGGALPGLISPELLCLLQKASDLREREIRDFPDDIPHYVEGNPFVPQGWEVYKRWNILSSNSVPHTKESVVQVRFDYGAGNAFTGSYRVSHGEKGGRITDVYVGGSCVSCQRGSLRDDLYQTLSLSPTSDAKSCKLLDK